MNKVRTAAVVAASGAAAVALVAAGKAIAAARAAAADASGQGALTRVASFDPQVTGVTVSADGRRFVNFPRWTEDAPISVAEVLPGGRLQAYPDAEWNAWRNAKAARMPVDRHFVCVQSVVADRHGALWVVDAAAPGNEKILPGGPKLVRIDLATDRVTRVIPFGEDVALQGSYLNDLRVSPDGRTGYITDSGSRGAIIVVDLESGRAFRALDGHSSTQPEKDVTVRTDGRALVRPDGRAPMFAADGIALSNDGQTLYFQALTGRTLYAIDTAMLTRLEPHTDVGAAVRTVGTTCVADGMWISGADTLYLTSPTDNSVKRWNGRELEIVVQDVRLRWPDTMSEGPDGTLYVTASHIQDAAWFKPNAPIALPTELFSFKPGN
jgi:sugar lactone lactonase YvrE